MIFFIHSLKIVDKKKKKKELAEFYNLDGQGRQFLPAVKVIPAIRLAEQKPRKVR